MGIRKRSVENSLKNIKATMAFEGLTPSNKAMEMSRLILEGRMTGNQATAEIIKFYGLKGKSDV